jgi:hypothetical protein
VGRATGRYAAAALDQPQEPMKIEPAQPDVDAAGVHRRHRSELLGH